jgi:ribonuclease P/MRP protein subunit RPP40
VLGGILFDIYIDDIDDVILEALLKKFADDTKLAMMIRNEIDARKLQANLDRLCQWADKWRMSFNVKKCKVMHFGRNNIRHGYSMNGCAVEEVKEEKDLGVWMEEDMRPSKQCKVAAQSANWALGQLSRAFHFRKASNIVPLYKTFIRPKLEHAVAAWSPWLEGDREAMEKVQKRMIRMISDKKGDSYEQRLESVGLTTLVERRERGDMIETFRTMRGFNRVDKSNWFSFRNSDNTRATRSTVSVTDDDEQQDRKDVLYMESVRLESRKNFFTIRVINSWNRIPDEIKGQKTVNAFKNRYDEWKRDGIRRRQQQQQQP